MAKEYYELLGVDEDASQEEIKQAYREKAKKYHPDSNSEHADEEKFKEINKAYEILGDEEKRRKYDQFGEAAFGGGAHSGDTGPGGMGGFQDLFEAIFGGGFGGGQTRSDGEHLKIPVTVTLEEAYNGVEKTFEVDRRAACDDCDGTGAADGGTVRCSACNGRGKVQEVRRTPFGRGRVVTECDECGGRGSVPETPCNTCNGDGVAEQTETVTVDIPAGVRSGQRLRVRGKGNAVRDGRTGDLFLYVEVEEHPDLERRDADLYTTVKIGVGDAALGGSVTVPTPTGEIAVDVPAGTQPGQVLRVEGEGMPRDRGGYGDLYVKVDVHIPSDLSEEQQAVFEELKEAPEREKSFFETVKDII